MNFKYRADIDGLRTIAVLSVLIFHLNNTWLTGGFVGVDVFFVISGYLITRIIVRETEAKEFSFSRFYERRIRRIFPALFAMMAFSALMAYATLPRGAYRSFFDDFKYAAGQISNFRFAREVDYMSIGIEASPLLHTWSLAVEEQFYLVWPIFILSILAFSCKKWLKASMVTVAITSLATCVYLLSNDEGANAFYMFYARAYELAIGAIVALHMLPKIEKKWLSNSLSAAGLTMILIAVFSFTKKTVFPGYAALLPSIGTALLIYAGSQHQGVIQKGLSIKPMVGIGLISYSLYLWHWPLITYYKTFMQKELNIAEGIIIGALSFIFAYLSYKFVETPFRNPKNKIKNWKLFSYSFAFVVVLVVAAHQMKVNEHTLPGRQYHSSEVINKYFKEINKFHKYCMFDNKDDMEIKERCTIMGNPNSTNIDAIIVGDSHAMHYTPTVEYWALKNQKNVYLTPRSSCPIFLHNKYTVYDSGKNAKCMMSQAFTKNIIKEKNIKHIIYAHLQNRFLTEESRIVYNNSKETKENYLKLLELDIAKNNEMGIHSTLLTQVPEYTIKLKHCYQSHTAVPLGFLKPGDENSCKTDTRQIKVPYKEVMKSKLTELESMYNTFNAFHPEPYLPQPVGDNGDFYYIDKHHINIYGAKKLAPHVSEFLEKVTRD